MKLNLKSFISVAAAMLMLAGTHSVAASGLAPVKKSSARAAKTAAAAKPALCFDESVAPLADGANTPDLTFFELSGPVKTCEMSLASGKVVTLTFDRRGAWDLSVDGKTASVSRDAGGFIKRLHGTPFSGQYNWEDGQKYFWGEDNADQSNRDTNEYDYNADGTVKVLSHGSMSGDSSWRYSDYKFDDHGNWISRTAKGGRRGQTPEEKTETRTITYY